MRHAGFIAPDAQQLLDGCAADIAPLVAGTIVAIADEQHARIADQVVGLLPKAIERAGETRFLPVVLTTLTALGALIPLAMQGSALYSPLAIVIIGGSISSLLLSRLVTPVLYRVFPPDEEVPVA
jgi:multidrug efflux pump subunit AcrB